LAQPWHREEFSEPVWVFASSCKGSEYKGLYFLWTLCIGKYSRFVVLVAEHFNTSFPASRRNIEIHIYDSVKGHFDAWRKGRVFFQKFTIHCLILSEKRLTYTKDKRKEAPYLHSEIPTPIYHGRDYPNPGKTGGALDEYRERCQYKQLPHRKADIDP
jgi:hypothetical protein